MAEPSCGLSILESASLKVVEASPDAKIVINSKREIIIFNARAELLFGCDRRDVEGKEIEVLLPERLREQHITHIQRYLMNPQKRVMGTGQTLLGRHFDGTEFSVVIELSPFPIESAGIFVLAVVRRSEDSK